MTAVFIGGSRAVSRLNETIRKRLDDLIQKRCQVLIGDASGADKAVQQHFADRNYGEVIVFCMDQCRNNVGGWPVRKISSDSATRGVAYYATKDIAMAREARCGIMLWDGKSKGTAHNMINLIRAGKKVLVYFSPAKEFHKLSTEEDLNSLFARCDRREIERLQDSLAALPPRGQVQLPLQTR